MQGLSVHRRCTEPHCIKYANLELKRAWIVGFVTLGLDPGDRWIGFAVALDGLPLCAGIAQPVEAGVTVPALVRRYGVTHAALERAEHVHAGGSRAALASRGSALARSNWVGGRLEAILEGLGVEVCTCSAPTWRAWLTGAASADDARVNGAILARVPTWTDPPLPVGTARDDRTHPRDAFGLALWRASARAS